MDEQTVQQITEGTKRLAEAAEALQQTLTQISAQQQEINAKVDKIVAAIEEGVVVVEGSAPHPYAKNGLEGGAPIVHAGRKTLSPLVTMILAKNGVEDGSDTAVLDKALSTLSPEQRIAVKSEMARAGIIQ
jgi:hypothetical protein